MIGLEQHSVASVVLFALALSNNNEARVLVVAARRCFVARCLVACVGAAAIGGPTAMAPTTPKTSWAHARSNPPAALCGTDVPILFSATAQGSQRDRKLLRGGN